MFAYLDTMAGNLSKLNELFYEDPLILARNNYRADGDSF